MDTSREAVLRTQLVDRRVRLKETIADSRDTGPLVRLLQQVEAALERLNAGSYGLCEVCHEPIEDEQLRLDPLGRVCLDHLSNEQQRAIERDLDLAYRIQNNLLPSRELLVNGWEICYSYEPAGPVSGDYCDIVTPETVGSATYFFFGDISGKGVAASLLMSHLHAIFRSLTVTSLPLNHLLEQANRVFCESTMSMQFATLVCGSISRDGNIEICNAGHCPPLAVRRGQVSFVESTGLPIGMFYKSDYGVHAIQLARGDTLVLYTDGVTETRNASGQEYGMERLSTLIARHHLLSPRELIATCIQDLSVFRAGSPRIDDLTIMVLKRLE